MKRWITLAMCLSLGLGLAAPAAAMTPPAQPDMEGALKTVAAQVKLTLDIDDDYKEFAGDYNDGIVPGWRLRWADEGREISVTCTEDAVVTELYRWESEDRSTLFYGFDAAFPRLAESEARTQAETWLGRLTGNGETARIDDMSVSLRADGAYRFSGRVLKNGLETPVRFELRISEKGLVSYERGDSYRGYVGALPSAVPAVRGDAAAAALAGSVATELYYAADASGQARLRYVPVGAYTIVDAQTGEAVDMDALYASFGASASNGAETPKAMASEAAMDAGRGLTEVELSSIANYADALPQETLDASLRAVPQLGLTGFELARCSYSMDAEGEITANLRYTCEMTAERLFGFSRASFDDYMTWGDRPVVYKYIAVNAKTGGLMSVGTSYPLWDGDRPGRGTQSAQPAAEAFLAACAPERYAESGLCALNAVGGGDGLTYARMHEGYFFPENYLYVRMNPAEQSVDEFSCVWDDDIAFAPSKGIVSEAAAQSAYIGALDVTLGYAAWPEEIDYADPILARYADWGYSFVESLRLAYYYGGTEKVLGVDALTGEPILSETDGGYVYADIAADARRAMIEALGEAGIGFAGGAFRPNDALTQREAVTLLLQAAGYRVDGWDDGQLKNEAEYLGFVPAGAWQPDRAVTRIEFIRMAIGASRYGAAAALPGVWTESFSDVAAEDLGYAAIAKAVGMAAGDPLLPDAECTRGAAAVMLYGFMKRP